MNPKPMKRADIAARSSQQLPPNNPLSPAYRPLVEACNDHGISRTVAFDLARKGLLDTFTIGKRRYVRLESLRTLPERIAERDAKAAA